MNRLIFHHHDNVSIRNDNTGVIPLIPILIAVLIGGGMALVAWAFFAELWISTMIFIVIFLFIWLMITGIKKGIVGRRGMILGIILIFAFLILAIFVSPVMFRFSIGPPDLNDFKTKSFELSGLRGTGTHTDGDETEEINDDHFYVSAWTTDDDSEKIIIQGKVLVLPTAFARVNEAAYRIYLTSGDSWGEPVKVFKNLEVLMGEFQIGDEVTWEHKVFEIQGSFDGWIKVEFWLRFGGVFEIIGGGWGKMAQDTAEVQSGKGDINFVEGIYEIGDMAELELDLGYAKGQYKLEVKALTTGEMLFDGFLDESLEGKVTRMDFLVKGSYVSIGTWPDCPANLIEAKLWNELFQKAEHETAVTDIKTLGPDKPTITLSNPADDIAYRSGETISITIKSQPNIQTQAAIVEYRLRISPGDIIKENSTDGKFTFKPPHRGTYKLIASCQDAVCRRSEVLTKEITIYDKGETPPFITETAIPWILIIVLLIWGTASAWIFYGKKVPGTKRTKAIVILAGFIIIALLFLLEVIPYG